MSFDEFRQNRISLARLQNIKRLYADIQNDKISVADVYRLKSHYVKYKELFDENDIKTYEDFIKLLKSSIIHLRTLEKDPTKQSIDEQLQIEYYNSKYDIKMTKLAPVGANALCFDIDKCTISQVGKLSYKTGQRTKSFDAMSKLDDGTIIYYCLKHVEMAGGAQDNQLNDVLHFIQNCRKYIDAHKDARIQFMVVLSGKYAIQYHAKNKFENTDKIKFVLLV